MGGGQYDLYSAKWFRVIILVGLCGGAAGNITTINQTDDRFRGEDFRREIAVRDARIRDIERAQQAHLRHSARYTQVIEGQRETIQRLERELETHMRGHP